MIHDKKLLGVCGETSLANAKQSLITMMQVRNLGILQVGNILKPHVGVRILPLPSHGQGL
jgi:hypothetical protein